MNKSTNLIKTVLFFLMILLFVLQIKAQVTIGTTNKPHDGALLDLSGGQSSEAVVVSKGMGLPRVALEKIDQLFPMLRGDSDYENGTTKATMDLEHIGLLVYNVSTCIDNSSTHPTGIYVWDGEEWTLINEQTIENVIVYQDQEGNDFYARLFGDAGIWMLQNLSVTKYAVGQGGASIKQLGTPGPVNDLWCYPGTVNTDPTIFDKHRALGLLYNWAAATNSKEHQGINEGGQNHAAVQGICPDGWHLPSDYEWTDIENEIIKNTSKYSNMDDINGTPLIHNRPAGATTSPHGKAMKAHCMIAGGVLPNSFGESFASHKGGFDAYLGGFSNASTNPSAPQNYGRTSYFWTSSTFLSTTPGSEKANVWNRKLDAVTAQVGEGPPQNYMSRTSMGKQFLTTVRCKKDTNTP